MLILGLKFFILLVSIFIFNFLIVIAVDDNDKIKIKNKINALTCEVFIFTTILYTRICNDYRHFKSWYEWKLIYYQVLIHFYFIYLSNKLSSNIYIIKLVNSYKNIMKLFYEYDSILETKFNYEKNVLIKQNKSLTWKETLVCLSRRQKTEFYAPLQSFWPLFISFSLGFFLILLISTFHNEKILKFQGFSLIVLLTSVSIGVAFWFSVFYLEKIEGNHNFKILDNIEMGFFLFLFTEALCFMSLFWVFLHSTLASSLHVGLFNPGEGVANFFINETLILKRNWNEYYFSEIGTPIFYELSSKKLSSDSSLYKDKFIKVHINFYDKGQLINPYKLPLLNTFILLSSAATLNLSHLSLKKSKFLKSLFFLFATILLGIFFVCVQYIEYKECTLQYNDGIYAACFFSLTGLHGFHVILGLICLIICFINILFLNYSSNFHQSFHYSILYWHFVDIIWILVYFIIYLWPSSYFFKGESHSHWIYYNHYSVHFDKQTFEKAAKTEWYNIVLKNNKNAIYNIVPDYVFKKDSASNVYNWSTNDIIFSNDILNIKNELVPFFVKMIFNAKRYESEFYLLEWLLTKDYFNYNEVKKNPYAYCFVMTIMHDEIIFSVDGSLVSDIANNKIRFWGFCILQKISKRILSLTYIYFFTPYMLDIKYFRKYFMIAEYQNSNKF